MSAATPTRRRLLMLAPLGVAVAGGFAFRAMLNRMEQGTFDPHGVPNPLVGHRIPDFALPAGLNQDGSPGSGFSSADLLRAAAAGPVLVNFFASWCIPCVQEAEDLGRLAAARLPIWGIAYKDKPEAVAGFLARNGNPYARLARDENGMVAINWGVYGVPESYLLDHQGVVRWRWAGGLSGDVIEQQLNPLLRSLA